MTSSNPRIQLLERDAVAPEAAAIYDALLVQRGIVPNMFKVLAYSPDIAKGVAGFLKPLLSDSALQGWFKELVAVRISILCESEYAIRAHSISAQKKGASEAQIAAVEKEKLGFRLADRLHGGGRQVDDAFYQQLQSLFEPAELVELFLTAAAFEMFPRFTDGLRIPTTPAPLTATR
jgi:AhpD family alkylhydroperoxidase